MIQVTLYLQSGDRVKLNLGNNVSLGEVLTFWRNEGNFLQIDIADNEMILFPRSMLNDVVLEIKSRTG